MCGFVFHAFTIHALLQAATFKMSCLPHLSRSWRWQTSGASLTPGVTHGLRGLWFGEVCAPNADRIVCRHASQGGSGILHRSHSSSSSSSGSAVLSEVAAPTGRGAAPGAEQEQQYTQQPQEQQLAMSEVTNSSSNSRHRFCSSSTSSSSSSHG